MKMKELWYYETRLERRSHLWWYDIDRSRCPGLCRMARVVDRIGCDVHVLRNLSNGETVNDGHFFDTRGAWIARTS